MERLILHHVHHPNCVETKFRGRRIETYKIDEKSDLGEELFVIRFLRVVKAKTDEDLKRMVCCRQSAEIQLIRRNPDSRIFIQVSQIKLSSAAMVGLVSNIHQVDEDRETMTLTSSKKF